MKLKQMVRYRLDFDARWVTGSSVLMALAFFLQVVYFFGFADLRHIGFFAIAFQLILPMLLEIAWLVLLRGVQLNAPGLFGILGVVVCVVVMVQTVVTGAVLGAIFSVITLLAAGLLVLAVAGGMLASRAAAVGVCIGAIVLRLILGGLPLLLPELAALCSIGAVAAIFGAFEDPKK